MPPTRLRRLVAVLGALVVLPALVAAAGSARSDHAASPLQGAHARAVAQPTITLGVDARARAAVAWRGGPITVSTGEIVRVFVSESLPPEIATPEGWAEFIAGLTHGPELSLLTSYIASLSEVQAICGARALGCYGRNQMFAPAELPVEGTTAEEVVRHEYGHHVAFHRVNPPWVAVDWGPKSWASAANVCARVQRGEAFPGDGGHNYARNPGEAWAETYRLMDERKAGITTATWQIIAPSFYPSEPAFQAAERDVLQPWTRTTVRSAQRTFGQRTQKVWWIPVRTPLDGSLRLTAALPRGGTHEVALVAGNRRTVIRRAEWVGQRAKSLTATVCGQRSMFVRVTQRGALGPVRVSLTTP